MKNLIFSFVLLLISLTTYAQVGVNTSGNSPDASAGLDVDFNNKGFLPPRITSEQRDAISNPAAGLTIFNISTGCTNVYNGINWQELCGTCTPQVSAPTAGTHTPSDTQIVWNWNAVSGAAGYKWSIENNYTGATDVNTATTYTQTGLSSSTSYTLYVWAYNICGGSATSVELNSTTTAPPCNVGSVGPGGGRIFYCGDAYPGYSGLEAALSDQSSAAQWGCYTTLLSGADGTTIGTGDQNTTDIMNGCGQAGIAARICGDLVSGGFDDWFFPSKDELTLMYTNLKLQGLGGFSNVFYWSSSETPNNGAWWVSFADGDTGFHNKDQAYAVRAVRRF